MHQNLNSTMTMSLLAAKAVPMHFLFLENMPVYRQLQMEEAILRTDERNWCLINTGSPAAIVMGISAKPELLINQTHFNNRPVPVIRRFSGGGTVFVDFSTYFVTWICNAEDSGAACIPSQLYEWTSAFYKQAFPDFGMELLENDYSIGAKKFGGNAQYLAKQRWLHHSSLLWDFDLHNMNYLSMPPKMPQYRQQRPHDEFLCRLKDHFPSRAHFQQGLIQYLCHCFDVREMTLDQCHEIMERPHRKATCVYTQ